MDWDASLQEFLREGDTAEAPDRPDPVQQRKPGRPKHTAGSRQLRKHLKQLEEEEAEQQHGATDSVPVAVAGGIQDLLLQPSSDRLAEARLKSQSLAAVARQPWKGAGPPEVFSVLGSPVQRCLGNALMQILKPKRTSTDSKESAAVAVPSTGSGSKPVLPKQNKEMLEYFVDGTALSCSASSIGRMTGKNPGVCQNTLVLSGAATSEISGLLQSSMLTDLVKRATASDHVPLFALVKVKYDETPAKVRIATVTTNLCEGLARDRVAKGTQSMIVPGASSAGEALRKYLEAAGATTKDLPQVATHAKLLQTQVQFRVLFHNPKTDACYFLETDLPCPLQTMDRTTGENERQCIAESLKQVPELSRLQDMFKFQLRHSCTDRAGANFKAERGLREEGFFPKQMLLHTPCDCHKASTCIKYAVLKGEQDTSGLINTGLLLRGDAGAMATLRQVLLSVLLDTMVIDHSEPPASAASHRQEMYQLFLPVQHVAPGVARRNWKRRLILFELFNGDLLSTTPKHFCKIGCCVDEDEFWMKLPGYALWALMPTRAPVMSRKNWLGQPESLDWCGLLEAHHQLYSKLMLAYIGGPKHQPESNAQRAEPVSWDDALLDFLQDASQPVCEHPPADELPAAEVQERADPTIAPEGTILTGLVIVVQCKIYLCTSARRIKYISSILML